MMISRLSRLRLPHAVLASLYFISSNASAATLEFIVQMNKQVSVNGKPQLVIDIGGIEHRLDFVEMVGNDKLKFTYQIQPRDFDANGITIKSPIEPNNNSSITDAASNVADYNFTSPDTSGIKIQTYTVSFDPPSVSSVNANAVSFSIAKAPQGARYDYKITSDGNSGATSVGSNGTITASPQTVSGVNVSSLPPGTLTLEVTITTNDGGTGAPRTSTVLFDNVAPTGYTTSFITNPVNAGNAASSSFQIAGGETGATFTYKITSSGDLPSGPKVTGSGTIGASPQQITGVNLSGLADGTLTVSVFLTDSDGNVGSAVTATALKDTVAPFITSVTAPADGTYSDL